MKAAVVTEFGTSPHYQEFQEPVPGEGELVVDVLAAGLHPRVRSQAAGSHYTSTGELPLIPGIDGVGRGDDGVLRYFVLPDTTRGSMAERVAIDPRRSVELPAGADTVLLAAALNPAMSSWVALRRRIRFEHGQSVLVLGATGSAGRLAVQVARHLGASAVVAAGRDQERLAQLTALGATATVSLAGGPEQGARLLGSAAAEVDVVLDYLWGAPTAAALTAVVTDRADRGRPLTWIEVGSIAGPIAAIPSAALRAARLQLVGSGQGSVSARDIVGELPALAEQVLSGTFDVSARARPLAEAAEAWAAPSGRERTVLVPG